MALYDMVSWILSGTIGIFFRDIKVRGHHSIPSTGPVIYIAAPHHNQFVDPLMLLRSSPRPLGFLCAQKTMDRKFVGGIAHALGAIGVTRPHDLAVKIPGALLLADPVNVPDVLTVVGGVGDLSGLISTNKIQPMFTLWFRLPGGVEHGLEIADIVNPSTIRLVRAVTDPALIQALAHEQGLPATVSPKIDHQHMYTQVFSRLFNGECIGIFPEGGSHDRSEFLPFKSGVCLMALGAMAQYPGLVVKLVPVGLSYFHADRFRSRAVVEYGMPIVVPTELVDQYAAGGADRRKAIKALMDVIQAAVANVTVTAPDYNTLMVVQAVRRLYRPLNRKLTLVQKLELTRRLIKGYMKYKHEPRVHALEQQVQYYNQLLAYYNLQDHQVERTAISGVRAFLLLVQRVGMLLALLVIALPGIILNAPIAIAASYISTRKAKQALAASTVKIEGRDVLATWKLLVALVLVPVTYTLYTVVGYVVVKYLLEKPWPWTVAVPLAIAVAVPYMSVLALHWGEKCADIYKSLAPLMYSIMPTRWTSSHNLRHVRAQLTRDLNVMINELGPTMFPDFNTFFMHDCVLPSSKQSQAGLSRVSSYLSTWIPSPLSTGNLPPLMIHRLSDPGSATDLLVREHVMSGDDLARYFVTSPVLSPTASCASSRSSSSSSSPEGDDEYVVVARKIDAVRLRQSTVAGEEEDA